MKEKPIIRSPYAYDPFKAMFMSEAEREELYSCRVDQLVQPFTVIDVLQNVYHRDLRDDLIGYIKEYPHTLDSLKKTSDEWVMSECRLKKFKILQIESVFGQPVERFAVDILCEADISITDVDKDGFGFRNRYPVKTKLRLRYCFCFVPCELSCIFVKAILGEENGIYSFYPDSFHLDKYLLPVLKTQNDYERMARYIIERDMPEYLDSDKWIFGIEWIQKMGLGVYIGDFPEQGVMGEYFIGFGKANVLDPETITYKEQKINPGTILLNKDIFSERGRLNAAATHEGIHHRLGYFYFMLQMCHGGCYSYLCKRNEEKRERVTSWTPVEIMELHANKLPAYILIQDKPGRAKAEEFYESYTDTDEIEKAIKLVNDMAKHFGTTKMIARSRLLDFGYRQVSGISVYINGHRVPSYVSSLGKNQTYTVDEFEAVQEYLNNDNFRKLIDTGNFVYVDGHYCVDDRKYISYDHYGRRHLSEYAKYHMDECCLVFDIKYENIIAAISGSVLHKTATRKVIKYTNKNGGSLVTEEALALRKRIEKEIQEANKYQSDFNQMTKDLMKKKGFTIDRLADETGLSVETIKSMRTDPKVRFNIETIAAVCIAMHLSREICELYIDRSPAKFLDTTVDMFLYKYAVFNWNDESVADVNRKLIQHGATPLTNLISGLDEDIIAVTG